MTQFKGCLKGSSDPTEAARTIEFLTRLGGKNPFNCDGSRTDAIYYIDEAGDIGSISENYIHSWLTLISLQKDCLLPVSWCVHKSSHKAVEWLFNKHMEFTREEYLGESNGIHHEGRNSFGTLLTESQFLALTAPSGKEEREIEGYVLLKDTPELKAGEIFYWKESMGCFIADGIDQTNAGKTFIKAYMKKAVEANQEWFKPKYKEVRKALFTTEDGVEVFEGDSYVPVDEYFELHHMNTAGAIVGVPDYGKGAKLFSTKQAAENYIVENAPRLNYWEVIRGIDLVVKEQYMEEVKQYFKQLIQSKIKG